MEKEIKFLVYRSADENVSVNAIVKDESIWLSQKAMGELFGCSSDNISLHLKNIFDDGELNKDSVTEKISATASDGKKYLTQFYNLDAIISVGYRVNSRRATRFRIWATGVLREYMTKGFVLDDERLSQGKTAFGKGYFDYIEDLIERENTFTMEQFAQSVNRFLEFRQYDILPDNGKVSKLQAETKAEEEYEVFNRQQKIVSDFDKAVKELVHRSAP